MDATIIAGSLDDKELRKSIDDLVKYVDNQTHNMASNFVVAMNTMKGAMKDFAVSQKVSVDLMQEAWKKMSTSFDAMVAAQSNATNSGGGGSVGNGGSKSSYPDDTIGHLQEVIAHEEKRRKEMQLNTQELRDQNALITEQRNLLKEQTTSVPSKVVNAVIKSQASSLQDAKDKLSTLETLQSRYAGTTKLSVQEQDRLTRAIAQTKKQIEQMQSKAPKTIKEVLGMDESSLEAITEKMRALKRVQIDPNNAKQVKDLGNEYQKLKRLQAELMGQSIQHTKSNNYLAQSFGYIRNRVVYALTLGAITSFTKQVYEIRGQYELLERSLGVLVNSFERGSKIFQELNQMAIESPFTLMELAGAAKQLTAYNFEAKEVVDTTRRLADISAALGVPMERLTYNLGQIRAQTVLTARDARDFANAGLPIVASLAEHYSELEGRVVTTGDVFDRMSKKMVSYNDVMTVLNKMTDEGGKFFEFQAKQAETLRVKMANLSLAWNNMLNGLGKSHNLLLTLPVSGLKALFENWKSIDRVIKSLIVSFGAWKGLQVLAIRHQWAWATATGATAKQMGSLANKAKGLYASMKALFLNPWTWVFVGVQALIDLGHQLWNAHDAIQELNDDLRDNAKEASESMVNYLNNRGNISTKKLAQENKLTAEDGEKAWESIRKQIEESALSANSLIAKLQAIPDINERVAKSFDYAERIQQAQAALADLRDDVIEVGQDFSILGINVSDGLSTELEQYLDSYKDLQKEIKKIKDDEIEYEGIWLLRYAVSRNREHLDAELSKTAESINNFISAYKITDPLQIREILERVKAQIKVKNPEIKGEYANIFDIELDKKMFDLTNGAVDKNATLWAIFLDRLKSHYHGAFEDINEEWTKSTKALVDKQDEAVDKNLEHFKKTMPLYYDEIKKMVEDASKLRINIGVFFGFTKLSDFQEEFNRRVKTLYGETTEFNAMLPTADDDLISWAKTQQDVIAKNEEKIKAFRKDEDDWSKEHIRNLEAENKKIKEALDLFNQPYAKEIKDRAKGEDVVAKALKAEIQLIKEMRSNYDKLRKSGVSNMEAIDLAAQGYEATILSINSVLQRFGITKFKASDFAGKDVRSLLDTLVAQRNALLASGKVKTASLKDLDVIIQTLTIDAKTYDMKKVTDGLNNELGKLKDEYELALELDANPELGDTFAELFHIDKTALPTDIYDYIQKVQDEVSKSLQELKLPTFNLLGGDIKEWAAHVGEDINGELVKGLTSGQNAVRNAMRKYLSDIDKQTRDLEYKLADNNGKIAIEKDKLAKLEQQRTKEMTEEQRHLLELQIQDQQNAINKLKDEAVQLLPTYKNLFNSIAEHSAFVTRKLAQQWKEALESAVKNADGTYTITDPLSHETATISNGEYGRKLDQVNKKLRETQPSFAKIKKAFTKDKQGVVDYAKGIELVSGELQKLGSLAQEIGNLAQLFGADEGTVEVINDIATSLNGVATAGQGIAQIASGDYIGGAASVLSGVVSVIGAWADNGNKRIDRQIKNSELAVKRLENSYKSLEYAIEDAYGAGEIGAKRLLTANKELQLAELKRQLQLEQSRKSKNKDASKIEDLKGQIIDLEHEITNSAKEIATSLLGISSVGDAAEKLVANMIEAFKNGEDYMKSYEESFEDMIDNMIVKAIASEVIGDKIKEIMKQVEKIATERADNTMVDWKLIIPDHPLLTALTIPEMMAEIQRWLSNKNLSEDVKKEYEGYLETLQKMYAQAAAPTPEDIEAIRGSKDAWSDEVKQTLEAYMKAFGINFGEGADKSLSALQQGIQGVTEDTAGAIEAYLSIVSQRMFYHGTLLEQIRDIILNFDVDAQTGAIGQVLFELQQSRQVQLAIQAILVGWSSPNGMSVRVEMV